jgi:hypothetical protein
MGLIGMIRDGLPGYEDRYVIIFEEYKELDFGQKMPRKLSGEIFAQIKARNLKPIRSYMYKYSLNDLELANKVMNALMENDVKNSLEKYCVELSVDNEECHQDFSKLT